MGQETFGLGGFMRKQKRILELGNSVTTPEYQSWEERKYFGTYGRGLRTQIITEDLKPGYRQFDCTRKKFATKQRIIEESMGTQKGLGTTCYEHKGLMYSFH